MACGRRDASDSDPRLSFNVIERVRFAKAEPATVSENVSVNLPGLPFVRTNHYFAETSPQLANASGADERTIQEPESSYEASFHLIPSRRRVLL